MRNLQVPSEALPDHASLVDTLHHATDVRLSGLTDQRVAVVVGVGVSSVVILSVELEQRHRKLLLVDGHQGLKELVHLTAGEVDRDIAHRFLQDIHHGRHRALRGSP